MAFTKKLLTAQITTPTGSANLSGLRMSFDAVSAPNQAKELEGLVVYGMTESQMNQLSNVGQNWNQFNSGQGGKGSIKVYAGDVNGMTTVFDGDLMFAKVDASRPPQVRMIFTGSERVGEARKPVPPTTQQGAVQASSLFATMAQLVRCQFANHGVNAVIRNPYFPGTAITQIRLLAEAANCNWHIAEGVLHAWTPGASSGNVTISKKNGLVASPIFDGVNAIITTAYQPQIAVLTNVTLQTRWTAANGPWTINRVHWHLDSGVPRGRWFLELESYKMSAPKGAVGP